MSVFLKKSNAFSGQVVPLRVPEGDDRALVAALRDNRPGAMELLYDSYAAHVQRVLARVVGIDPALPELLHDVFIEIFTHAHSITNSDKLRGWITSVTVFTARGFIKRRAKRMGLWFGESVTKPEIAAVGVDFEVRDALSAVYRILDRLPADERIAFALRFMEGMALTEVADATRVSLATVKRRLFRAHKRFFAKAHQHPVLREWIVRGEKWSVE